jgi:hypothetical protein
VACSGVVVLREIVVKGVLLCRRVGFWVGIGVRVERVLPRIVWDVVRCVAGVFFLEVGM